jgi:hypothetical protein
VSNTLLHHIVRRALLVAALLVLPPVAAHAQQHPKATVALVRELPDSTASATIIRTSTQTLVLLRERDADAATLATAMASAYRSQNRSLEGPDKKLLINLHGQRTLASLRPNERQLAERSLARLRAGKLENVNGVGQARVTTVALEAR